MQTETARRAPIGAILLLLGGALAAVGSFLTWANVSVADVSASATGVDGSDGYITLAGGLLLMGVGAASVRGGRRVVAIIGIVAAVLVTGVGVYDAVTVEDSVLGAVAEQLAPQIGATVEQVRAVLDQENEAGNVDIELSIGLFLVIGGGVLGLLGSVLAAVTAPREVGTIPEPGPSETSAPTTAPSTPPPPMGPPD